MSTFSVWGMNANQTIDVRIFNRLKRPLARLFVILYESEVVGWYQDRLFHEKSTGHDDRLQGLAGHQACTPWQ